MHLDRLISQWRNNHSGVYFYHKEQPHSYQECWNHIVTVQSVLSANRVDSANIGLLASGAEYVLGYWSLLSAGGAVVPLSIRATDRELAQQLQDCDCTWILCDTGRSEQAARLAADLGVGIIDWGEDQRVQKRLDPT